MSISFLLEESQRTANLLTIEATVVTGFENVALEECKEKLGKCTKSLALRGRIFFNVQMEKMNIVEDLRSVDNLYIVIKHVPSLSLTGFSLDEDIRILQRIVEYKDVEKAVKIWRERRNFKGITHPSLEIYKSAKEAELKLKALAKSLAEIRMKENEYNEKCDTAENTEVTEGNDNDRAKVNTAECEAYHELDARPPQDKVLKYRVTCIRNGKHCFGSQEAAHHVGGKLQDMFNWIVDLNLFDMEFMLNLRNDSLYYGIALTKQSKHHRNIAFFGPTTLRSTICYNMLRLAKPETCDIIIDPMCGGGSIPIEGLFSFGSSFYLCGDVHERAVARTQANLENPELHFRNKNIDAFLWDITCLPIRDSSVDIFITDLPFGKRSGSVFDNRLLYKKLLVELARVVRCRSGRAVLLTYDRRSFNTAIAYAASLWKLGKKMKVNIGGLEARVYVLKRLNTDATMPPPASKKKKRNETRGERKAGVKAS